MWSGKLDGSWKRAVGFHLTSEGYGININSTETSGERFVFEAANKTYKEVQNYQESLNPVRNM